MRSIRLVLLSCLVLLCATEHASAWFIPAKRVQDYTIRVRGHHVGFSDWRPAFDGDMDASPEPYTLLECGPLGSVRVPFSARLGCVLTAGTLVGLVLLAWLLWRRLRGRRHHALQRNGAARRGFEVGAVDRNG
jgi:hypothetical protein